MFTVNDTLDDILDESGDEEESDAIVTQVLDEIGIDTTGKVCTHLYKYLTKCVNGRKVVDQQCSSYVHFICR